jgi:hypothetical protein
MYLALSKVTSTVGSVSYERGVTTLVDQFCMFSKRGLAAENEREGRVGITKERMICLNNASLDGDGIPKLTQSRSKIGDGHVTIE